MTRKTLRTSHGHAVVAVALAIAAALASQTAVMTQSTNSATDEGLVGTWIAQVTLRDCATNAPLGPPFTSLGTFHRGGTGTGSTNNLAFAAGQRTEEHQAWTYEGAGEYVMHIAALILFATSLFSPRLAPPNLPGTPGFNPALPISPGFFAGLQTVTQRVTLINANEWTSRGTNAFYRANGQLYRTGCSTATAQRLQ